MMFKSKEECIEYVKNINPKCHHDRKHNLYPVEYKTVFEDKDILFLVRVKNNGSMTLIVIFSNSVKGNVWKFWTISLNQLEKMPILAEIYNKIEENNAKIEGRKASFLNF